jgi:DNA invertase Pin-like site-specific DNA recombinase
MTVYIPPTALVLLLSAHRTSTTFRSHGGGHAHYVLPIRISERPRPTHADEFGHPCSRLRKSTQILTDLRGRGVLFALGASVHDRDDPFGRLFLQTLAMVAEFEANLNHLRTREGMAIAKRNGKLKGKQPKLPESAQRSIRRRYDAGEVSLADLAEEYSVGRSTVHRVIHRQDPGVSDGPDPSL